MEQLFSSLDISSGASSAEEAARCVEWSSVLPDSTLPPQAAASSSSGSSGFATPLGSSPPTSAPSPLEQRCSSSSSSVVQSSVATSSSSSNSVSGSGSLESSALASDSEEGALPVWTRAQVKEEAFARDRCLLIIGEFVYDVSGFMRMHPGGREILQENAGADATNAFNSTHSARARRMMARYCVARLPPSRRSLAASASAPKPDQLLEAVRNALQKQ